MLVVTRGVICNGDTTPSSDEPTEGIGIYSTASDALVSQVVVANTSAGVFSPDSSTVYVPNGTDDGPCQINVVDIASAAVTNVWTLPGSCSFNSVAVSSDGTTLWASIIAQPVDVVHSIVEVNATTGELINQFPLTASSIALSPDGTNLVFSGGTNGDSVGFLNIATGQTTYLDLGFAVGPLIVVP
jgi:Tol biopolymer transport system component